MIVANQLKVLIGGRKWSEIFPKAPDQHSFNGLEADPPTGGRRPSCIRFDAFLLDLDRCCLFKGDSEITLRPKTLAFLQHLVANPGRVEPRSGAQCAAGSGRRAQIGPTSCSTAPNEPRFSDAGIPKPIEFDHGS